MNLIDLIKSNRIYRTSIDHGHCSHRTNKASASFRNQARGPPGPGDGHHDDAHDEEPRERDGVVRVAAETDL